MGSQFANKTRQVFKLCPLITKHQPQALGSTKNNFVIHQVSQSTHISRHKAPNETESEATLQIRMCVRLWLSMTRYHQHHHHNRYSSNNKNNNNFLNEYYEIKNVVVGSE